MRRVRNHRRMKAVAALLVATTFVLPLGPCLTMGLNTGVAAFNFGSLLDENQMFLGLFAPCGQPNVQYVDADGVPTGGVQFAEDDLIVDCPVRQVQTGG
jgi:hypothetical protein